MSRRRLASLLVLDGVLDASAVDVGSRHDGAANRIGQRSYDALVYGVGLGLDDPARLAGRLYAYGRCPTPRRGHDLWLTRAGVACAYGLRKRLTMSVLRRDWKAEASDGVWLSWTSRAARKADDAPPRGGICKVYVSPSAGWVDNALAAALQAVDPLVTSAFKLACGALGLARPDKIVFYVSSTAAALAFAERLRTAAAGLPEHGVPFACQVGGQGLVSVGWDVDALDRQGAWSPQSWRKIVTDRLADGIVLARAYEGNTRETVSFAVGRLELLGLDLAWRPPDPSGVVGHSRIMDTVLAAGASGRPT